MRASTFAANPISMHPSASISALVAPTSVASASVSAAPILPIPPPPPPPSPAPVSFN